MRERPALSDPTCRVTVATAYPALPARSDVTKGQSPRKTACRRSHRSENAMVEEQGGYDEDSSDGAQVAMMV